MKDPIQHQLECLEYEDHDGDCPTAVTLADVATAILGNRLRMGVYDGLVHATVTHPKDGMLAMRAGSTPGEALAAVVRAVLNDEAVFE